METSNISQLPEFTAERYHIDDDTGSFDLLKVRCERCENNFWVQLKWKVIAEEGAASDGKGHRTRPCPYCFRTSWLPGEHPDQQTLFVAPVKRRVVKRRKSKP